jgi:hypothetical protein
VALVDETGRALADEIVGEVQEINSHVAAIVEAAREQSTGLQRNQHSGQHHGPGHAAERRDGRGKRRRLATIIPEAQRAFCRGIVALEKSMVCFLNLDTVIADELAQAA